MDIKDYVNSLGFTNFCYKSAGGRDVECYSNLDGMWAKIDYKAREIEFSTVDGLIKSSVVMGYPNSNIPYILNKLKRHVFDQDWLCDA